MQERPILFCLLRQMVVSELLGRLQKQSNWSSFYFKSDFIKLRNISLSYNFNTLIKEVDFLKFVKGLSLTASCRNAAIIYKDLPGLDPEAIQSSGDIRAGYENSSLPTTRNYNLTLNVKF
jgi:hypothetical protein